MKTHAIQILLVFCVALGIIFFSYNRSSNDLPQKITLEINGATIEAEVATTDEEKIQGLSGREMLGFDQGMLFAFDVPDFQQIWMKDMKFSIDILWLDEDMRVIYVEQGIAPETYPKIFAPPTKAYYVLELEAGFVEKNGIKIGDIFLKK